MKNFKLFVELSDDEARKVRELGARRGAVLDHLFKGKERVFFPLPPDPELYKLKKILESIPHPRFPELKKYKVEMSDLRAGMVRLLQKAKHPEKGEYISDKNTTTIARAMTNERENPEIRAANFEMVWNDIQPYWVVVSRHPIDVKRMSDFPNLQSCHSYGGEYYRCTDEEVESGGAVAYLISTNDFAKVNQGDDEIFADKGFRSAEAGGAIMPHRGIEGISPVARTRIRRAEVPRQGREIGVVEDAVYGVDETGHLAQRFLKALKQWVTTKQPDSPQNYSNYEVRGGEYGDTSIRRLHRNLYERNPAYLSRIIEKLKKLNDVDKIKEELRHFVGRAPTVVMRMGGKRIWVGEAEPMAPSRLFFDTWLSKYVSTSSERLLDPNKIVNLLHETDGSFAGTVEKYVINMLNRGSDAKLVHVGNTGWTIVVPVEIWIKSASYRRLDLSPSTGYQNLFKSVAKMVGYINKNEMKRKLQALMGNPVERTGPLDIGEIVYHPYNGKALVTQAASGPGHSVQVRWFADNSYNFVPPDLLFRKEADAQRQKAVEEERRAKNQAEYEQRRQQTMPK